MAVAGVIPPTPVVIIISPNPVVMGIIRIAPVVPAVAEVVIGRSATIRIPLFWTFFSWLSPRAFCTWVILITTLPLLSL